MPLLPRGVLGLFARDAASKAPGAVAAPAGSSAEWRVRGNAALARGELDGARECYRQATLADPADPLPWLNLGYAELESGDFANADESLARSLSLARAGDDFLHDAHFLRARACEGLGERSRALAECEAAIAARPGFAEAIAAAARLLLDAGRAGEALGRARELASIAPSPVADLIAARALEALGRPAEALAVLDATVARDPGEATAHEGRGSMLMSLDRAGDALAAFERALALRGPTAPTLSNIAAALHRLGRHEEALERAHDALDLEPDHRDAHYNLASILMESLRLGDAIAVSDRALRVHPDDADLQWNLAIAHLLRGEFADGWRAYESRWGASAYGWKGPPPDFGAPRWTGREPLRGRTLLVFAEQGLGDSIQFLRFIPGLAGMAREVVLRLPRPLCPLARGLAPNCTVVAEDEALPPFDAACPMLSLPLALGIGEADLARGVPYLRADPARVEAWRMRIAGLPKGPRVGLVWSGNPGHANDRNRSIPLAALRRLAVDGCAFVSLQQEARASDRAALDDWPGLARMGEELRDFADTAALVCALDLVVSVDTSVAHLAGALGRPVWVLLPHYPDWRWMLDREDSPWYPTARLWRQPRPRDWAPLLEAVRAELERVKGIEPSS